MKRLIIDPRPAHPPEAGAGRTLAAPLSSVESSVMTRSSRRCISAMKERFPTRRVRRFGGRSGATVCSVSQQGSRRIRRRRSRGAWARVDLALVLLRRAARIRLRTRAPEHVEADVREGWSTRDAQRARTAFASSDYRVLVTPPTRGEPVQGRPVAMQLTAAAYGLMACASALVAIVRECLILNPKGRAVE